MQLVIWIKLDDGFLMFFCPTIYQIDNTNAFDHEGEMNHKDDFGNMDQLKK